MTNLTQPSGTGAIGEVEALCAELVAELGAMVDMLMLYRQTVADAARYIARGLADPRDPTLTVTEPGGHELAAALARMGGVSAEVDMLLSVPVATLRAATVRLPRPRVRRVS